MKKIECVIMDWAGTAVDYGCFAPVAAFLKAFAEKGLTVTMEEARGPMGMTKIDHIRELFKLPSVTEQFKQTITATGLRKMWYPYTKNSKNTCSPPWKNIRLLFPV